MQEHFYPEETKEADHERRLRRWENGNPDCYAAMGCDYWCCDGCLCAETKNRVPSVEK